MISEIVVREAPVLHAADTIETPGIRAVLRERIGRCVRHGLPQRFGALDAVSAHQPLHPPTPHGLAGDRRRASARLSIAVTPATAAAA